MENVSKKIIAYNKSRLPNMIPLKYKAMAENLFRFYRGTNHLFCEDIKTLQLPASPIGWLSGDLHLENFGSFKSDNRLVYFDLNDFDEAILGPLSYELLRMTTSIFIAFETLQIEQKRALNMAQLFLKNYSKVLAKGKTNYIEPHTAKGIVCEFLTKASKRNLKSILKKRTEQKKHRQLALSDPRHFKLPRSFKKELFEHITGWLKQDGDSPYNYKPIDAAFRLAGTGSIGLKRYVILLKSLNDTGEKYLLIDMKQSALPAWKICIHTKQPFWPSEAERIIKIQQRMQNRPPALLSATIFKGEPFVIQEMQPTEDSINLNLIKEEYRNMYQVIDDMAMLTASSHLRSSGQQGSCITDTLISFGLQENWQEIILQSSIKYAHQVKTDYILFLNDYKKGVFTKTSNMKST